MFRNKHLLKVIAYGLLLNILSYTLFPTVAYALTSGPTAPEATSFEPVDTTDMVNLMTGDMAYSLPILDVPGPEGNYPLALSYHSGIFPDEDASWVGLGWSLNPGAITRKVNGAADDHSNAKTTSVNYVDIGAGKAVVADVAGEANSMGLIYSSNNMQGFAGANYMAVGLNSSGSYTHADIQDKVNSDIKAQKSMAEYAAQLGGNNPISKEIDNYVWSELNKAKPTHSIKAIVPIPKDPSVSVYVENNFYRYYKTYTDSSKVTGPLKYVNGFTGTKTALDCYPIVDESYNTGLYKPGGSLPAYDNYTVTAQGLSGSIRPYIFENGTLFRQDVAPIPANPGNAGDTRFYNVTPFAKSKVNFRFQGDFSNSFVMDVDPVSFLNSTTAPAVTGNIHENVSPVGYNASTQQLAGSKHIEWFTNEEVSNGTAKSKGFMGYNDVDNQITSIVYPNVGTCINLTEKFNRSQVTGHIAGYMITNESGMTYHYALPVYSYNEFTLARTLGNQLNRIEQTSNNPYAYQWLLTGITGLDYVDANNNGILDDADTGHWVSFGYGKWTDKFAWRTPDTGYNTDIDANTETFTGGRKELYYLDYIRTRTHTALFFKEIRKDGKGVSDPKAGGYILSKVNNMNFIPVSTLRLKEIHLYKNSDLPIFFAGATFFDKISLLKSQGTLYNDYCTGYSGQNCAFANIHMGDNVLDVNDMNTAQYNALKLSVLKMVSFSHDYSLCDGTPNSFDTNVNDYYTPFYNQYNTPTPVEFAKTGKLTLNSVKMYGRGGADLIPGTNFSYGLPSPNSYTVKITNLPGSLPEGAHLGRIDFGQYIHPFVEGDIISFTINSKIFYASLVTALHPYNGYNNAFNVIFFGNNTPTSSEVSVYTTAYETKNPGYRKDFIDKWGFFKSDFDPSISSLNGGKKVTPVSQRGVDAWCLRTIETPIGAKMNITYESDQYQTPETYNNTYDCSVSGVYLDDPVNKIYRIGFSNLPDLINSFTVGSRIDLIGLMFITYQQNGAPGLANYTVEGFGTVTQVNQNYLLVQFDDPNFNSIMYNTPVYGPSGIVSSNDRLNNFVTGVLRSVKSRSIYGGGVRVKNLAITGTGFNLQTNYVYDETPGYTSGVTSFEPNFVDQINFFFPPRSIFDVDNTTFQAAITAIKEDWRNKIMSGILANVKELPGPGVVYGYVAVKENSNGVDAPKYNKYHFETFSPEMVTSNQADEYQGTDVVAGQTRNLYSQIMKINKFSSKVGSLRSIVTYDKNNRAISRVDNTYLYDKLTQNGSPTPEQQTLQINIFNMGMITEAFTEYKYVNQSQHRASTVVQVEYPNIPLGTEVKDLLKGTSAKTYVAGYDYFSGQTTKTLSTDSYGNVLGAETVPAYKKYPEMGLKVNNINNRHMLIQPAAKYVYESESNGYNYGTLSADITTWNKNWNYRTYSTGNGYANTAITDNSSTVQNEQVYRSYKTYKWNAPMLYPDGSFQNFVDFDWTKESNGTAQNKYWQVTSEATLFDAYSHPLEVKDINGNYASTKMGGYLKGQVVANATNSRYTEMTYAGGDEYAWYPIFPSNYLSGEVYGSVGDASRAHTGSFSMALYNNQNFNYFIKNTEPSRYEFERGRTYRASVWVHKDFIANVSMMYTITYPTLPTVIGTTATTSGLIGDWYKMTMDIPVPATTLDNNVSLNVQVINNSAASTAYIDDFRFQPVESTMSAYVYDNTTGQLTHILDNENMYTRYEYDPMGRLLAIYKETINGEKKLKDYYYNYARK